MLKNTEAIIYFILFSHQFSDRSYGSYTIKFPIFKKIKFDIKNYLKKIISKRRSLYDKKHQRNYSNKFFPDYSNGSYKIELSDHAGSDLYNTCKRNKTFGKASAR